MSIPLRLLLVEDSPNDAELVLRELRRNDYDPEFERVDTGEMMKTALEKKSWDFIIADYSMPTFSGLEALKLIQEKKLDLPFILVSGTIGEEIAVTAMKAGAHDYVLKDKLTRLGPAVARELREVKVRSEQKKTEEERARLFQELKEAVRARDEFLSIASHELRTPLTPLQLHIENMLRRLQEDPPNLSLERMTSSLEIAKDQIRRLTKLIETLLDISRITSGRLDLQYEEVDLTALAIDVAERMHPEMTKVGSPLVFHADKPVRGTWDRMRLQQVISNLLSNAIKYGPGKPIEVRVDTNGNQGRFSIRDHGIGIAKKDQARIFGRFERAVPAEHYGGFGLGLWIVGQIVSAHGGTIRVESRKGEGAQFEVEFPKERLK